MWGNFVVLARNCLPSRLDYIVMQIRKIALGGVHVVSAIVSEDFSMGIGAWSWSQHRSGVCQIIKWKRVGCEHKDFILKNDEVLKTFPASHFSEQR